MPQETQLNLLHSSAMILKVVWRSIDKIQSSQILCVQTLINWITFYLENPKTRPKLHLLKENQLIKHRTNFMLICYLKIIMVA